MSEQLKQQEQLLDYYKTALVREKEKNNALAGKLADAENKINDLQQKLDKIKNNPFWKMTKPFRVVIHWCIRMKDRITRLGSPKNILRKLKSKKIEHKAMKRYGTESFPTPEQIADMRAHVFPQEIKFSILVPLYNTPSKFLREMIDSVVAQTYHNWELCLADGSDDAHAYVGEICRKYQENDSRIVYKKLEKNEGISGNTNQCYTMATGNYIALFDHDYILHPCVLFEYIQVICYQGADYIYCD